MTKEKDMQMSVDMVEMMTKCKDDGLIEDNWKDVPSADKQSLSKESQSVALGQYIPERDTTLNVCKSDTQCEAGLTPDRKWVSEVVRAEDPKRNLHKVEIQILETMRDANSWYEVGIATDALSNVRRLWMEKQSVAKLFQQNPLTDQAKSGIAAAFHRRETDENIR